VSGIAQHHQKIVSRTNIPKYVDGTMLLDEVTQAAAAFAVVSGPATGSPTIMRALPMGRFRQPRRVASASAGPDRSIRLT
jgi:hypothetical protein